MQKVFRLHCIVLSCAESLFSWAGGLLLLQDAWKCSMCCVRFFMVVWILISGQVMAAPNMKIMTKHPSHPAVTDSIWLKEYRMMRIEATGPGRLPLSFRQVLVPDRVAGPVDLTIVRDDEEQGTIRFSTPGKDGELSQQVMVLIDVPAGTHTFRLLVSGPQSGVVVKPVEGKLDANTDVIEVTTSLEKKLGLKFGMLNDDDAQKKKTVHGHRRVIKSQTDVIGAVSISHVRKSNPQTALMYNNPDVPTSTLGPGAMTAGGLMFVFLMSSASLAASAGLQSKRARQDPSLADELLDRARRTNKAALVMAGAAGAALVTALVMYLVEGDNKLVSVPDEPAGGFSMHF